MKAYVIYALAIGMSTNLVLVIIFYWMFFVIRGPNITLVANNFGEFWIDFFLLQFCLIFTAFAFINETRKYYKNGPKS